MRSSGSRTAGIEPLSAAAATAHSGQSLARTVAWIHEPATSRRRKPAASIQLAAHVRAGAPFPREPPRGEGREDHRRLAAVQDAEQRGGRADHAGQLAEAAGDVDHGLGPQHRDRALLGAVAQLHVQRRPGRVLPLGQAEAVARGLAEARERHRARPSAAQVGHREAHRAADGRVGRPARNNLYKFRLATPTGESRMVNVAIAPLVTRKFNVIGRLIIVDDITERIDLESQLSQADKLSSIGLLAAGVAHEVNTPLAVISSYAQMLSKQLQDDPQKGGLLEKITRQTFRASEIVNNLLNFSRTSGTEFTEVNINKIIGDTMALLEHQFKITKIRVEDDLADHLPLISGNSGRLQQVFLNLFLNARDAMPEGGTLRVATSNGDGVSVVVSDTGTGIAQEHIQRIYDPFFTTKSSPREGQGKGTGLGLSVTYGIIQEHAGKIRVESPPGQGTTFYLDFPLTRKAVNV